MRRFLTALALSSLVAAAAAAQPALTMLPQREHIEAMRHLRLGQEQMHAEHWDRAETEFKAAVKLEPTLELAHYGLGQVYMNTKRFPDAVTAYLACRDAFVANTARLATNDLVARRQLDDQIRALEDEQTLLSSGRVKPMFSGGPADLDRRITQMKASRFHDDKAMPGTPAWISIALGSAYFRSGAMIDAEREYRATLTVDPKLGEAHNNLAVVCMLTGRYPEADEEIRAAEKTGFKVNPQLKADLKNAAARP